MTFTASAHVDTFTRDHLPPANTWPALEFTLPELQYPERLNAAAVLIDDAVAEHGPERPALRTPDGTVWTYGELQQRANQVAQVLTEDFGVVPGNRVLLRGPNNPVDRGRLAWRPESGRRGGHHHAHAAVRRDSTLIQLTKPVVAISDHRFVDELAAAAGDDITVLTYGEENAFGDDGDLAARCESKSGKFTTVDTSADDVALLGPTSGTTGAPKVTMHFHRDILANADTFARYILQPTPDDVFAGSPPLAFTFGLGGLVVFPLRFGASSLLTERAAPVELAENAAAAGATILFTAPTAYRAILKEDRGELLSRLRIAVSAGEHLPKETWHAVHEATGLRLVNGIGATEMLHVFISAAGDDIRPGTTGRAVPGYRATILDDEGNELGPGQAGRLAVIGPTGCRYLDDARQTNYVVNGWNVTGDTFIRDEDGYFTYQARSDNMIVSSGYNIGAPEVESAIDQHPDVMENAVIGVPDPERGSIVCAFIVLREGVTGDAAKAQGNPGLRQEDHRPVQVSAGHPVRRLNCHAIPAASCSTSSSVTASRRRYHERNPGTYASRPEPGLRRSTTMKIAIVGGGPGGLYFAALMKQLDPSHDITLWERNAASDTFGFGVVFSDETLGGIGNADAVVADYMSRRFARWSDIDIHFGGEMITVGGQGFAAMSRKELLELLQRRCAELNVDLRFQTIGTGHRGTRSQLRSRAGRRRRQLADPCQVRRLLRTRPGPAHQQIHVARYGPGVRSLQVLREGNRVGRHADPRLPVLG